MDRKTVHMFVFEGLSDWEPAYAIAGINRPAFQRNPGRYQVKTVGTSSQAVETMGGLRVVPHLTFDQVRPSESAMLILPGGESWDALQHQDVAQVAAEFLDHGTPVAAICGATAGLARAGLLDHRRHTSNARDYLLATHYHGAHLYQDVPAVTDAGLITASGMASLEFAEHIFRCLDVFSEEVLQAWYGLFKTGRKEYFESLMRAAKG